MFEKQHVNSWGKFDAFLHLSSISTKSGKNLELDPFSLFKWRLRMGVSLNLKEESMRYMSFLRWDMASDLLIVIVFLASLMKLPM